MAAHQTTLVSHELLHIQLVVVADSLICICKGCILALRLSCTQIKMLLIITFSMLGEDNEFSELSGMLVCHRNCRKDIEFNENVERYQGINAFYSFDCLFLWMIWHLF